MSLWDAWTDTYLDLALRTDAIPGRGKLETRAAPYVLEWLR
jgi:hypothetical protein